MIAAEIARDLAGNRRPQKTRGGWLTWCPAHEDDRPSLSVSEDGIMLLVHCHAGCSQEAVIAALKERGLWPRNSGGNGHRLRREAAKGEEFGDPGRPQGKLVAIYDYRGSDGELLFQVCRFRQADGNKTFRQRRPDPHAPGEWIWNLKGVERVLYRLPELMKADPATPVFIVEGEKDADGLAFLGLKSTTNPGGAGKWRGEYGQWLKGRHVVIIPDNDPAGKAHAQSVAKALHGEAAGIRILELPGLHEKGDVSDWLHAGGTVEQLLALVEATPKWQPSAAQDGNTKKTPTQAEILIALAAPGEFFHDSHQVGYVSLPEGGGRATFPVKSNAFRLWLRHAYFLATGKAPNAQALGDALGVLEARALFNGPTLPVFLRVGENGGKVYLDLGDSAWRVVEVDAHGWRVLANSPVKFVRKPGMHPLLVPQPGGSIDGLRPFINLPNGAAGEKHWRLILSWLVMAFRPIGPYPILAIHGPQGSAKSTTARMLRSLLDPNSSPLRAEPKELRDLVISAKNGWCCAFDNLTSLPQWLSDGLCRLATGGGFATRALYTDDEEALFEAMRPVILTGINPVAASQDLIDRQVLIELQDFADDKRQVEATIWQRFEEARPRLLGALLTGVSVALRRMETLKISRLPRMADFAIWASAAETAWGWPNGAFLEAYGENRVGQAAASVEADLVASTLVDFMQERDFWEGTPTELHEALTTLVPEEKRKLKVGKSYAWPQAPNVLTRRLRKAQVFLKQFGLWINGAHSGVRTIRIDKDGEKYRPHRPYRPNP